MCKECEETIHRGATIQDQQINPMMLKIPSSQCGTNELNKELFLFLFLWTNYTVKIWRSLYGTSSVCSSRSSLIPSQHALCPEVCRNEWLIWLHCPLVSSWICPMGSSSGYWEIEIESEVEYLFFSFLHKSQVLITWLSLLFPLPSWRW